MLTSVLSVLRVLIWLSIIPAMLLRISFASGAGLLPIDLLLPLYSFLWLFDSIVIRRQIPLSIRFLRLPIIWCCIGFIGYIYSKYYMSSSEMILSLWHMIRFISLIIWGISYTELVPKRTEKMIMIIYCILVILGFIAFYLVPDMGKYSKEGQWDPHIGRFLSTLLDPNYMAGMLLFMITTLLSRILQPLHFSRYIYNSLFYKPYSALYDLF